jgi:hypothetical protein
MANMIEGYIDTICIIFLSLALIYYNGSKDVTKYTEFGGILVPEAINASNHPYPYAATAVSLFILFTLVILIIRFGGNLATT